MQTRFTPAQLADPDIRQADGILRTCVHCGMCAATCPTHLLLGDERDGPRGRIYMIKDMLERDEGVPAEIVPHIDRCLSCLACATTCPSGVDYMHLIDHARGYIERHHRRPLGERLLRRLLGAVLPRPALFRLALGAAGLVRPIAGLLPAQLDAMVRLAPKSLPQQAALPPVSPAAGPRRRRVALLAGCAQPVLAPSINQATVRLLTRLGCEVVIPPAVGCCGALTHHLGQDADRFARAAVDGWTREIEGAGLDAILTNAAGCGTMLKDYGHVLRDDAAYAAKAARVAGLVRDVSEFLAELGLEPAAAPPAVRVTWQSPCSLRHGQRVVRQPLDLLRQAGFAVAEPAEAHLCCGSAGSYNLLQPDLAARLRDRKLAAIARTRPDVIASANIGCITQLAVGTEVPVVHLVELLDWTTGGPKPAVLGSIRMH